MAEHSVSGWQQEREVRLMAFPELGYDPAMMCGFRSAEHILFLANPYECTDLADEGNLVCAKHARVIGALGRFRMLVS